MNLGHNSFIKVSKLYAFFITALLAFTPIDSFANAWLEDKGKTKLTTDLFYSAPIKFSSASFNSDSLNNTLNNNIANKTSYTGTSFDVEYGLHPEITFVGDFALFYYDDHITVSTSENNASTDMFSVSSNYYNIDTDFGFKNKLYKDDYSVLSSQILFFPGNLVIKDTIDYLQKRLAFRASLLYGHSFNIPFGMKGRPDYGNYIDLEVAYKQYPISGKQEAALNASMGLRPFNNGVLLVFGFYNTINGYNYTKRPFSASAINAGINNLSLTPELANSLNTDIANDLLTNGNTPYNQINFQIGIPIDKDNMLYLQSFHNVIQQKAFTENAYYISLESNF